MPGPRRRHRLKKEAARLTSGLVRAVLACSAALAADAARKIGVGALLVAGSACYLFGGLAYVAGLVRLVAAFVPPSTPIWAMIAAWVLVVPAAIPLGWAAMIALGWWSDLAPAAGLLVLGWALTQGAAGLAGPGPVSG